MSTRDFQDPVSSRRWQRDVACDAIGASGTIVVEYFDVGCSRRLAWTDRPQAAALLAAILDPDRGFDAVIVGEYERAFYGDQLLHLAPLLARHGVHLWLPETHGPVDLENPTHQALIMLLGHQSRREVLRARFRTTAAMRAQAAEQGRHLGGRPPYGYRLVDAGPHPNAAHARWGRRLHRLEPDPTTAPHVRWMFAQRLAGTSVAAITRALNEQHVPCPSGVDPDRNPHRPGTAWTLRTVAAILSNPRYTGRQVWNRQRTDRDPDQHPDLGDRRTVVHRWNPKDNWVISTKRAHPALVNEADFITAQTIRATRPTDNGATRHYLLAGLVRCQLCRRRMDAHWVNQRPGYRCRHGHNSSQNRPADHPANLYVREDHLLHWLATNWPHAARDGPDPPSPDTGPKRIVAYLRSNNLTIGCDRTTWTLQPDPGGVITPNQPSNALIPHQRTIDELLDDSHHLRSSFMG